MLSNKRIVIIVPADYHQMILPLTAAYGENGIYSCVKQYISGDDLNTVIPDKVGEYDAALLIGSGKRAPRTVLDGPFISVSGKRIPVGWVPVRNEKHLERFVTTAVRVHNRKKGPVAMAILAQRHPRFLKAAKRMQKSLLKDGTLSTFKWTSDLLFKEEMIRGLRLGLGCAIYFGHGVPNGWEGYYGTLAKHFDEIPGEPLGAILSISCLTASRRRVSESFSESLLLRGITAASFGAVEETLHANNWRWGVLISDSLKKGITTIGELISDACPPVENAWRPYRIIGDPLAPLSSLDGAVCKAGEIKLYP